MATEGFFIPAPPSHTFDASQVGGNAPEWIKKTLGDPQTFFKSFLKPGQRRLDVFGKDIEERMEIVELSIIPKAEEPKKLEGRAVCEVDVTEGEQNIYFFWKMLKVFGRYGEWRW